MSPADEEWPELHRGFPRVSGDEPADVCKLVTPALFSPRERG